MWEHNAQHSHVTEVIRDTTGLATQIFCSISCYYFSSVLYSWYEYFIAVCLRLIVMFERAENSLPYHTIVSFRLLF